MVQSSNATWTGVGGFTRGLTFATTSAEFYALSNLNILTATEANTQSRMIVAGDFSRLSIHLASGAPSSASGSFVEVLRKNGVSQTNSINQPNVGGWIYDAAHTDTFAATDLVGIRYAPPSSSVNNTIYGFGTLFDGSTCLAKQDSGITGAIAAGSTSNIFWFLIGDTVANSTSFTIEADAQSLMRTAGSVQGLQARVTGSAQSLCTLTFRNNGVSGNNTITMTSGVTGLFVDTTHTDTFVSSDKVSSVFNCTSVPNIVFNSVWFIGSSFSYEMGGGSILTAFTASTTPAVFPIVGAWSTIATIPVSATQNNPGAMVFHYDGQSLHNIRSYIKTNTLSSNGVFNLYKNGSPVNGNITIPSAGTGWFEDTTNTDAVTSGDTDFWYYAFTGSTGGTWQANTTMLTVTNTSGGGMIGQYAIFPDITWGPVNVVGY